MNPPHVTHTAIHTQFPLYTTVAACPVAAVYGWGVSQNSIKTNSILQTPPLHFTPPLLGAKVQDNPLLNEREWRLRVRAPTVHPIQQPAVVRPSLGYAVNFHHLVPNLNLLLLIYWAARSSTLSCRDGPRGCVVISLCRPPTGPVE